MVIILKEIFKFSVRYYKDEYERNSAKTQSPKGKAMKAKRQSTVEPVFRTLTQFMGLRKINTTVVKQANTIMQLSAIAYNLKKHLKFTQKKVKRISSRDICASIVET